MPLPPWVIPAAQTGGDLLSQGINAVVQNRQNKKQREWAEYMYNKQRSDNLADWAMVNEYNSPASQMQRYKDARLNPNLIYGQTNEAPVVKSAEPGSWNPQAPRFNIGGAIMNGLDTFLNLQAKTAQIDLVKEQQTVAQTEALLKRAQTYSVLQGTEVSKFDLGVKQDLRANTLEVAKANLQQMLATLDKTKADTFVNLDRNEREAALHAPTFAKAVEEVLYLRAQRARTNADRQQILQAIENMKKDGTLKDLEINMRRLGINPNDPTWQRMLAQFVSGIVPSVKKELSDQAEQLKNHYKFKGPFYLPGY